MRARGHIGSVLLAFALVGCGDDQEPEQAGELWDRIHAQNYRSWSRAPGYATRLPTAAPHGNEVDIYVNDTIQQALAAKEPLAAWPLGSLIVKDGWDGSDLEIVAVMEKRTEGWFWAEY